MTLPEKGPDPWVSLRYADYRRFLMNYFATALGLQVAEVIVAWQMYLDTRDPLSLGLVGLAEALPNIAAALLGGHTADRVDRRRLAVTSTVILFICATALAVLAGLPPRLSGTRVVGVYIAVAIMGTARAFLQPARIALAAQMIPREHQANAVTWRSSTWQLGAVIGPALGGVLNALLGSRGGDIVAACLIAIGGLAIWSIGFRSPPRRNDGHEPMLKSLVAGIRYLRAQQVLLAAMTLDLFSVLLGGAVALLPIFVVDILHTGAWGLGVLRAAPAVGALCTSIWIASRPPMRRAGRSLLNAVAIFGVFTIAFGLARVMWLSFVCLAVTGAADMISVVIRSTLMQLLVPDHLMGRVSGVNAIFIGSSNEIGSFESGVTAKLIGTVPAVLLGGGLTIGVVGATAGLAPDLRAVGRLEDLHP